AVSHHQAYGTPRAYTSAPATGRLLVSVTRKRTVNGLRQRVPRCDFTVRMTSRFGRTIVRASTAGADLAPGIVTHASPARLQRCQRYETTVIAVALLHLAPLVESVEPMKGFPVIVGTAVATSLPPSAPTSEVALEVTVAVSAAFRTVCWTRSVWPTSAVWIV